MTDQASKNRAIIEEFAAQFDPPLKVVATQNIDNRKVAHGHMAAYWDDAKEIGVTAICWGRGHFKAYLEVTGNDAAADAGRLMAKAVKEYGI